jgi:hypothetical protein
MFFGVFDFETRENPPSSAPTSQLHTNPISTPAHRIRPRSRDVRGQFPADGVSSSYPIRWNAFKQLAANCSTNEKAKLFSDTAKRVYRLA